MKHHIIEIPAMAFAPLYRRLLRRDFARGERRPLASMRGLYRHGQYRCFVWRQQGRVLAYACFITDAGDTVLLDYLGVSPQCRGQGLGSQFLAELMARMNLGAILVECENPALARDEEDAALRRRRLAFYERAGARLTHFGWQVFGVDYSVLCLPVRRPLSDTETARTLLRLYRLAMPRWVMPHCTQLRRM